MKTCWLEQRLLTVKFSPRPEVVTVSNPACDRDGLTFVAVPDGVAVDVEVLVVEEEETEPRLEGVDGHDEEDAHDPPLLGRVRVVPEVLVDLKHGGKDLN